MSNKCSVIIHLSEQLFTWKRGERAKKCRSHEENICKITVRRQELVRVELSTEDRGESLGKMYYLQWQLCNSGNKYMEAKTYWWIILSASQSPREPLGTLWWNPKDTLYITEEIEENMGMRTAICMFLVDLKLQHCSSSLLLPTCPRHTPLAPSCFPTLKLTASFYLFINVTYTCTYMYVWMYACTFKSVIQLSESMFVICVYISLIILP